MVKKLDPMLVEILSKYGIDGQQALWDCHGTLVMYHRYVEQVAAQAGVSFGPPTIIEGDAAKGVVSLLCSGKMGDREEWSVGECSPKNNKNSYPYAMAEKRAKDRVVLKLVGLHGFVYSENEGEFDAPPKPSSAKLKRDDVWPEFERALNEAENEVQLESLKHEYREKVKADRWPKSWIDAMADAFAMKSKVLEEFSEHQEQAA